MELNCIYRYFSTEKDSPLKNNYSNLFKLSTDMISIQKDLRPNCNRILSNDSWAMSLDNCKNATESEVIDSYSKEIKSSDESFHRVFMYRKLKLDQIY